METPVYKEQIPQNMWQIMWLDKVMSGHKGFVAGGCFKDLLLGRKAKDIDIFFESEDDFQDAVHHFNELCDKKDSKWKFKYRNEKCCAFQEEGQSYWVELVESKFGTPEEILRAFDFTVVKIAYFKKEVEGDKEGETKIVYRILYHEDFFEHMLLKRLVLDENIPFPVSTFNRTYRYSKYGFSICSDSKRKLLRELIKINPDQVEGIDFYAPGGWD